MKLRLAMLMALAAAGLHFAATRPAQAALARAGDEQRRLRAERRQLAERLAPLERRAAARARALAALAAAPLPEGHELHVLRRGVLSRLAGRPLTGVRVAVRPGRGGAPASLGLACEGQLSVVLEAARELVQPGAGLVLARARFAATPGGVALELDAHGVRRGP